MISNSFKTNFLYKQLLRTIFVQVKTTPNPLFLKFIPSGKQVMPHGTLDITAARYSYNSPLAKKLFSVDGITRVFYGKDYISVGIKNEDEWGSLKPIIFDTISNFFDSEEKLF